MNTEQLIDQIALTAKAGNWDGVQRYLNQLKVLMSEHGRPLGNPNAYRLVEALAEGVSVGQSSSGNAYGLIGEIEKACKAKPCDGTALLKSWQSLYGLLANPTTQIESADIRQVLASLRSVRAFDMVARTADRGLARAPQDTAIRCAYGQALIDTGQTQAAIEILKTVINMPGVSARDRDEAYGMIGRANKQIYVDHITSSAIPISLRQAYKPYLARAIESYGAVYDANTPGRNFWHGINLVGLLQLARDDGHGNIPNPAGIAPEEIARRIIAALEPQASSGTDPWIAGTLGQAYLAIGDYQNAAKYYGLFARHDKLDAFALMGTVRQIEQVARLTPGSGGGGPILAMLKNMQIGKDEGKFTLPGDELKSLRAYSTSKEYQEYRETNVAGGGFIQLDQLQKVVARAAGVVAICDVTGKTHGTGFLISGGSLHKSWEGETLLLTNAHVMSQEGKPGHEPGTLSPGSTRVVLEDGGAEGLQIDPELLWQSAVCEHDAVLARVTSKIGTNRVLPLSDGKAKLEVENPDLGKEGTRISVIGHPLGGPLSLSIVGNLSGANGRLVGQGGRVKEDGDPVYLHYRAPTEPGNSGSPVFEAGGWNVIGLHHMGFDQFEGRPKLCGSPGKYMANEGVSIDSIRRAIARDLSAGTRRNGFFKRG